MTREEKVLLVQILERIIGNQYIYSSVLGEDLMKLNDLFWRDEE